MTAQIDGRIKPGVERLWRHYYSRHDCRRFDRYIAAAVTPDARVLEIGAGSGQGDQTHFALRGKAAEYIGLDLDPRVLDNPHLDRGVTGSAEHLPFEDASFDLVFHTMTAEHLADPVTAMMETARVLKPGGTLLFQTPNRWHYPQMLARITPHWFHEAAVSRLGSGRKSEDVFPTVYRLNDRRQIWRAMDAAGLTDVTVEFVAMPPGYLRFSRISFLLGVAYERTIERAIPAARGRIIVRARR